MDPCSRTPVSPHGRAQAWTGGAPGARPGWRRRTGPAASGPASSRAGTSRPGSERVPSSRAPWPVCCRRTRRSSSTSGPGTAGSPRRCWRSAQGSRSSRSTVGRRPPGLDGGVRWVVDHWDADTSAWTDGGAGRVARRDRRAAARGPRVARRPARPRRRARSGRAGARSRWTPAVANGPARPLRRRTRAWLDPLVAVRWAAGRGRARPGHGLGGAGRRGAARGGRALAVDYGHVAGERPSGGTLAAYGVVGGGRRCPDGRRTSPPTSPSTRWRRGRGDRGDDAAAGAAGDGPRARRRRRRPPDPLAALVARERAGRADRARPLGRPVVAAAGRRTVAPPSLRPVPTPLRVLVGALGPGVLPTAATAPPPAGTVLLDLGPEHPSGAGLVELRLWVEDGVVTEAHVVVGAMHRGVEKLFEVRDYRQVLDAGRPARLGGAVRRRADGRPDLRADARSRGATAGGLAADPAGGAHAAAQPPGVPGLGAVPAGRAVGDRGPARGAARSSCSA